MSIKKYTNGSWIPASRKYGTETDTITTLPATIIGDGTPISSYTIKGNMEQSGTPTPGSPIYPSECGERTENLFDVEPGMFDAGNWTLAGSNFAYFMYYLISENTVERLKRIGTIAGTVFLIAGGTFLDGAVLAITSSIKATGVPTEERLLQNDGTPMQYSADVSGYSDIYLCIGYGLGITPSNKQMLVDSIFDNYNIMLNSGSTALPYEPYGYKLPLTLGSTTTNIYLGEVQSTRRIKKLVLDGTEDWVNVGVPIGNTTLYQLSVADLINVGNVAALDVVCTHFECGNYYGASTEGVQHSFFRLIFRSAETTLENWKTFLAQQYANGTPVTVWYVLAEPTTGIVNEPLRKIGDYADSVSGTGLVTSGTAQEFDVGTALKPSEVDLTYHGWHEHDDTKYST